jgi:hypothetical protein
MASNGGNYFRSQLPSWSSIESALAIFALVVIFRTCCHWVYSWFAVRSARRSNHARLDDLQTYQPPRHLFAQPHWAMDEKAHSRSLGDVQSNQHLNLGESDLVRKQDLHEGHWGLENFAGPRPFIMSRPPPRPPLTPPELSNTIFTYQGRPSSANSQKSFIHQPNPDYASASNPDSFATQTTVASPNIPRRRSYKRTIPIGIPGANSIPMSEMDKAADMNPSPSSYPPTNQLLPPPPPGHADGEDVKPEWDVRGEILSVLDREGAGWTRHTRVYGGGTCLACAATGGNHQGGFYGATVRPEEMR